MRLEQIGQDGSVGQLANRHPRQVAVDVGLYFAVGERHGHAGATKWLYVRQYQLGRRAIVLCQNVALPVA